MLGGGSLLFTGGGGACLLLAISFSLVEAGEAAFTALSVVLPRSEVSGVVGLAYSCSCGGSHSLSAGNDLSTSP